MRSKVSKLVETCWQVEKWLRGLKRKKLFCGFADVWPKVRIVPVTKCLQSYNNNKWISWGYDWLSFIYHLTTMSELSCGPIRKYIAKNTEYDEEKGMCFTLNKTYDTIFFLSTSLMPIPVSTPNHLKKHHQCDHIMKIRDLFNFKMACLFLAKHR